MVNSSISGPSPLRAAWSILRARRVKPPHRFGTKDLEHAGFLAVLQELARPNGLAAVDASALDAYLNELMEVDPDELHRAAALAYWLNLYNAAAIRLAQVARRSGHETVLAVPGAFDRRELRVAGEALSLNDVEHGKIRRFADPRIHAALVCGSLSCPTLRPEPFAGDRLHDQLDEQMRSVLAAGGAVADRRLGQLHLSRVFLWYGSDFDRPDRMPTWLPSTPRRVALALTPWMADDLAGWVRAERPKIAFQPYDWGLGCTVG